MSDHYQEMENALMRLDTAVGHLARQADQVRSKIAKPETTDEPELFAPIGGTPSNAASMATRTQGQLDFDKIERKLDATITQIEDLLSEEAV